MGCNPSEGGCWRGDPSSYPPWRMTCWPHDGEGRFLGGTFRGCPESDPGGTFRVTPPGTGSAWAWRPWATPPGEETHWGTCAWENSELVAL